MRHALRRFCSHSKLNCTFSVRMEPTKENLKNLKSHLKTLDHAKMLRGVRSATVIELATGAIITSTADAAAVAALAEHVPPLLARARACSSTVGAEELSLLLVSSRRSELLICGDAVSGAAVVVDDARTVANEGRA